MPRFAASGDEDVDRLVAFVAWIAGREQGETGSVPGPGRTLYTAMGCSSCHGNEGRGDGPAAATLVDDDGRPIAASDLRYPGSFRLGRTLDDVVRTIRFGVPGTPMPAYGEVIDEPTANRLARYLLDEIGLD